jgi:hypothetical protein
MRHLIEERNPTGLRLVPVPEATTASMHQDLRIAMDGAAAP